eukprot:TRINITY_DN973_c0_g1_i2.p1 TRINITY_DN973_c0_g1~~TRINITY_DN973_c0_g1_i2.p1  ORF type:complete len:405 (+),score=83.24 TRINITY_DN973_c0_g1_i2:186-1400(+)
MSATLVSFLNLVALTYYSDAAQQRRVQLGSNIDGVASTTDTKDSADVFADIFGPAFENPSRKPTQHDKSFAVETISGFEKLLKASPGHEASIVVIGDSTISGMVDAFLHFDKYPWLVYTANDRSHVFNGLGETGGVKPGEDWSHPGVEKPDTEQFIKDAVARGRAATQALHALKCNWGGGLQTLTYSKGALQGLVLHYWSFIPENSDGCWQSCFADAMKELQSTAIVWNVGMHVLSHKYDHATCLKRAGHAKDYCNDYSEMLTIGLQEFSKTTKTVVWRTTNSLCDAALAKRNRNHARELALWHDDVKRSMQERKCHRECPFFRADEQCYDWFMDGRATELQYNQSMNVVQKLRRKVKDLRVLDAFALTRRCCESGCDATEDGVHYFGSDPDAKWATNFVRFVL